MLFSLAWHHVQNVIQSDTSVTFQCISRATPRLASRTCTCPLPVTFCIPQCDSGNFLFQSSLQAAEPETNAAKKAINDATLRISSICSAKKHSDSHYESQLKVLAAAVCQLSMQVPQCRFLVFPILYGRGTLYTPALTESQVSDGGADSADVLLVPMPQLLIPVHLARTAGCCFHAPAVTAHPRLLLPLKECNLFLVTHQECLHGLQYFQT